MTGLPSVLARLAILVLVGVASGCGPGREPPGPGASAGAARRIITLSPHLAELAFAAGAGSKLVAVVEYSNYPEEARRLPRVGDAFRVDFEAVAAARPDLILAWPSGNSPATLERLRGLGYRVVGLEPTTLADVGRHILLIGELAGTYPAARVAATDWESGLELLRRRYRDAAPVRLFYQIAPRPLVTVTGRHFIGQAIRLCGGDNVFADVPGLAPVIGLEAVIAANPEVIVASALEADAAGRQAPSPLEGWRSWSSLTAVADGNLFVIDPNLMSVPGPRMLLGIRNLCTDLDQARLRRPGPTGPVPVTAAHPFGRGFQMTSVSPPARHRIRDTTNRRSDNRFR
jgi:iron complex transport system substrate-binding protein